MTSSDDGIWRAVADDRTRALQRLDAMASTAVGKALGASSEKPSGLIAYLAEMLARDLTAIGLMSHDRTEDAALGGVWLAISPDLTGVVLSWTQHDASVAVLGVPMHDEIQRQMRSSLHEILHTLGYRFCSYGAGVAFVVTGFRPPLITDDASWAT